MIHKKRMYLGIFTAILIFSVFYAFVLKEHTINESSDETNSYPNTLNLDNRSLEQEFTCVENSIDCVSTKIVLKGSCDNVKVKYKIIQEKPSKVVVSGKLTSDNFKNKKYLEINFNKIEKTLNKKYKLCLEMQNQDKENNIGFIYDKNTKISFLLNNKKISGSIIMKVSTRRFDFETFIMTVILLSYVLSVLRALYRLFKA